MTRQRAIVTGGAGFIGSHLVDLLVSRDYEVLVIDPVSKVWTSPQVTQYANRLQNVFLSNQAGYPEADVIFHLAGHVGPVGVLSAAGEIVATTVEMADMVSVWANLNNCPLVDVSTSEVYGSPDAANKETDPLVFPAASSARREYAIGKLAAEAMLIERNQGIIIRPFNVAGPRQQPEGGFVLPRFVIQALKGEDITVYSPGTQERTFTHVLDIVEGMYLAAFDGTPGQVYNLGNEANLINMDDLAGRVLRFVGDSKSKVVHVNPVELHGFSFKEAAQKVANSTKARTELGWTPTRDLDAIVGDTVWYWRAEGQ